MSFCWCCLLSVTMLFFFPVLFASVLFCGRTVGLIPFALATPSASFLHLRTMEWMRFVDSCDVVPLRHLFLAALTVHVCRQAPAMPPCSSSRLFPPRPSTCQPAATVAWPPATATLCPPPWAAWSRAPGLDMALPLPPQPHPPLLPPAVTPACSPAKVSQVLEQSKHQGTFPESRLTLHSHGIREPADWMSFLVDERRTFKTLERTTASIDRQILTIKSNSMIRGYNPWSGN